jgi:hypothetical protein
MRAITCPRCGTAIERLRPFGSQNKPFCARCGWNLERAELAVSGKSNAATLVPISIAIAAIVGVLAATQAKSPFVFLIPLVFGSVVLIPLWSSVSMRKAVAAAKLTANPSLVMSQPPLDPVLQQLQVMPRPRRVRFRVPGALATVLVLTVVLGIGGLWIATSLKANRSTGNVRVRSNPTGILVVPIVFVVLLVVPYFRDKRNVPLMRDGELALGRITYQQNMSQGKSSYSRIGYEFKTSSGQLIQDQAKDLTYTVYEDMIIPVFYDPTSPAKNVTPCATYLQVSTNPF